MKEATERAPAGRTERLTHETLELIEHLAGPDAATRRRARENLVARGERVVDILMGALRDPRREVRWEVVRALGEIAAPRTAAHLVRALDDGDEEVRWLAAEGLGLIGTAALKPLLEALARRCDSPFMRQGAHHVLGALAETGDAQVAALADPVIEALEGSSAQTHAAVVADAALDALHDLPAGQERPQHDR